MSWDHQSEFNSTAAVNFTAGGAEAIGTIQSSNGFHFLRVFNAGQLSTPITAYSTQPRITSTVGPTGHMVPRDQPENALKMINAFMSGHM